ncbi:hypothetical protein LWI28_021493 [Acer negundo]|uniref:Uncharacterized protein n=1 Tax=Acer negundo TaxID=4023 RepID=A0AAD5NM52_ACENE|nr:hypothetical protein LWI28_021493 [Acer negundo]
MVGKLKRWARDGVKTDFDVQDGSSLGKHSLEKQALLVLVSDLQKRYKLLPEKLVELRGCSDGSSGAKDKTNAKQVEDEDEDLAVQPLNVDQEVIADEPKVDVGGEAQIEVDEALIIAEIEDN